MSLTALIPYFESRCDAAGLTKFNDAFGTEIPSTILDNSYHIRLGDVTTREPLNQHVIVMSSPITILIWLKGYRDTASARDGAIALSRDLIKDCLLAVNRFSVDIKNIEFNNMIVEPLGADNDNIVQVSLGFNCVTVLGIDL